MNRTMIEVDRDIRYYRNIMMEVQIRCGLDLRNSSQADQDIYLSAYGKQKALKAEKQLLMMKFKKNQIVHRII